eukprot:16437146-Heterocapsa_arctica.AAC.2
MGRRGGRALRRSAPPRKHPGGAVLHYKWHDIPRGHGTKNGSPTWVGQGAARSGGAPPPHKHPGGTVCIASGMTSCGLPASPRTRTCRRETPPRS